MDSLIALVKKTYSFNEILEQVETETQTEVFASLRSVSRQEFAAAGQLGLYPEFMAVTNAVNYSGEKVAIVNDERFAIYRTFRPNDSDEIELYCQREVGA